MASTLPDQPITPKSLYTITGAAAAVWLFGAVLYTVLGPRVDEVIYRSIAFGLSLLIAIGMLIEKKTFTLKYWLLIIPNSALIFVNASGYNAVNTGSFDAPGVESKNENSANTIPALSTENGSIQEATFLPFLKDIAWWPDPLLSKKIELLEKKNDSLKTENKILFQKTIGFSTTDSLAAADNRNKIAAMEAQIAALQLENKTLKTGNDNNSDLAATIEKLNNNITSLHKQITDKDNQLKNCDSQLQQAKNELATANTKLNECLKRGGTNDALNERIKTLSNQLDQNKRDLITCENANKSLSIQLKSCKDKLSPGDPDGSPVVLELQDKVKDLQSKLNSCQGQIEKYSSALKKYGSDLGLCNTHLKSVRDSLLNCQRSKVSKIN